MYLLRGWGASNLIHATSRPALCQVPGERLHRLPSAAPARESRIQGSESYRGMYSRSINGLPVVGSKTHARGPDRILLHMHSQVRTLNPRAHTWPSSLLLFGSKPQPYIPGSLGHQISVLQNGPQPRPARLSLFPVPGPDHCTAAPALPCGCGHRAWSPLSCPSRNLCRRQKTATATSQAEHNELESAAGV